MTDIDFFKTYNDTYGHLRGDDCLKQVAKALDDALKRPLDLVARYGGEEFVVLLPDTDSDGAAEVAKLMQENIANMKITHSGSEVYDHLTISLGIATITPSRESTPDVLIDLADKALYQAKAEGRNRFKIFSDPK
jgi:diguanylate cyclase (GGDEF)-like protein